MLSVMMVTLEEEMDVMTSVIWSLDSTVQEVTLPGMILVMKLVGTVETLVIYRVMMEIIEMQMDVIIQAVFGVEVSHVL